MIIETRTESPDFVGFVSGVDLKKIWIIKL